MAAMNLFSQSYSENCTCLISGNSPKYYILKLHPSEKTTPNTVNLTYVLKIGSKDLHKFQNYIRILSNQQVYHYVRSLDY